MTYRYFRIQRSVRLENLSASKYVPTKYPTGVKENVFVNLEEEAGHGAIEMKKKKSKKCFE